jgi:hypothetical protein
MTGQASVTINQSQTPPAQQSQTAPQQLTPEQAAAASAALKAGATGQVTTQAQPQSQQQQQQQQPDPNRPAWLPEKFKSAEDMAKAYGELEKKLGGNQQQMQTEQKPGEQQQQQQQQTQPDTATEVVDVLKKAGVDYDALQAQFAKDGKLDDKSYEALAKGGFSKQLVDSWIAGQQAIMSSLAGQVHSVVGGAEKYAEMVKWAATNLTKAEIDAFNAAVNSGVESAKFAAQGLAARFVAAVGDGEPALLSGSTAASATGETFRSRAEQVRAMQDSRYDTDPAYRKEVEEKSMRSNF